MSKNKIQHVTIIEKVDGVITKLAVKYSNRRKTILITDSEIIGYLMLFWIGKTVGAKSKFETI